MDSFLKIYLPLYLVVYITAIFIWPSYRTFKQTGINPITFGKSDNAHDYIGFIMKILIALLFITVICFSVLGEHYKYLLPIWYLEKYGNQLSGLILIHIALVWIFLAQRKMNNSWRIGIDKKNKTDLVTDGVFRISRNPIFFGMMISVMGLFLILPNMMTFFLFFTTCIIIQIQIRLEEEFLEKQHGQTYLEYKRTVRRLI
ncbi:isoprenylcysteine carboxylmethyltransferase family protein [Agriterribacter sp.]|uniref:methyltransferase family protein n=1 Tax=Agriterribacter sp. TaxID=2821509 RepID=UPI002B9C87EE|nr:isoprenylcysteine carboxylmethyltransferase family protein [Agriterribacter sp.]HRO46729.1 isoprenylcysteine carboxylmethyltransferase family protein [Agriterribacter sp.]